MTLFPSVNSAAVQILTAIADGQSVMDATGQSTLYGLVHASKQRVVLKVVSQIQDRRPTIDAYITAHLRDPQAALPPEIHAILAIGIAQLHSATLPPRLVVSGLVSLVTDLGYSDGLARLVNAILVAFSIETNAEDRAAKLKAEREHDQSVVNQPKRSATAS